MPLPDVGSSWQDGSCLTPTSHPAEGSPRTPKAGVLGATLLSLPKRKRMKIKGKQRAAKFQRRRTLRLTEYEDARLSEQAKVANLSVSEYMRRRFFGGRPLVAYADTKAISELRRIGGLLKNNFETLRQAGAPPECFRKQEETLRLLGMAIEKVAASYNDRKKN